MILGFGQVIYKTGLDHLVTLESGEMLHTHTHTHTHTHMQKRDIRVN